MRQRLVGMAWARRVAALAVVALAAGIASRRAASGCAVSESDVHRWETTEGGPEKLYAIVDARQVLLAAARRGGAVAHPHAPAQRQAHRPRVLDPRVRHAARARSRAPSSVLTRRRAHATSSTTSRRSSSSRCSSRRRARGRPRARRPARPEHPLQGRGVRACSRTSRRSPATRRRRRASSPRSTQWVQTDFEDAHRQQRAAVRRRANHALHRRPERQDAAERHHRELDEGRQAPASSSPTSATTTRRSARATRSSRSAKHIDSHAWLDKQRALVVEAEREGQDHADAAAGRPISSSSTRTRSSRRSSPT